MDLFSNGDYMFRIALCDDNPEDLVLYEKMLRDYMKDLVTDVEILTYQTPGSLLFAVEDINDLADTMFLDIRMPGTDGIELVKKLRSAGYKNDIVYLTNSEEDMLRAFDVGALNYMVKNKTSQERAEFVVRQAVRSALKKQSAKLILTSGGETRNIPIVDVRFFEVKDHLIVVHYGDDSFTFISSMGKIENRLESQGFIRIHRAYLVSSRYIKSFNNKEVVLITGEYLPVSRKQYPLVRKIMFEIGKV